MVTHISTMRQLQEDLHLMGHRVEDTDFSTLLMASLPDSWDSFTSAYWGAQGANSAHITSYELSAILIDEDRRRKPKMGGDAAFQSRSGYKSSRQSGGRKATDLTCYNCDKKGHTKAECWSKGGGKEGQGPQAQGKRGGKKGGDGRGPAAHQAEDVNNALPSEACVADETVMIAARETSTTVTGIGSLTIAIGRGTVILQHQTVSSQ